MKKYIFFICIMHMITSSFAQDTVMLRKNIDEITITATRTAISVRQLAQSVLSISKEKINQMQPQTTADLLQKTGLITVQKSQQGGGSPILRGLEANRILLVVDGVRMNNIIYRGGHLQNIITVDPNILDRAEVLFGPASSVYGSDALGGVIHLITKTPQFSPQNKFLSSLLLQPATWAYRLQFFYRYSLLPRYRHPPPALWQAQWQGG